jgi:hypothetical protein
MRVLGSALALLVVCLAACAAEQQGVVTADAATSDRGASVDRPADVDAGTRFDVPTFDVPTFDVTALTDAPVPDAGAACTPVGEVPYASHTSREEFNDPPSCAGCPRAFTNVGSLDLAMVAPGATTLRVEGVSAGAHQCEWYVLGGNCGVTHGVASVDPCTWFTCMGAGGLDWGVAGDPSDNPTKDIDNVGALGPENVFLDRAPAGTYHVVVEYWGSGLPSTSDVDVTIRERTVARVRREGLPVHSVWYVGTVTFPEGTFARVDTLTPVRIELDGGHPRLRPPAAVRGSTRRAPSRCDTFADAGVQPGGGARRQRMARGTNAGEVFIASTVSSIVSQLTDQHDPVRRLVKRTWLKRSGFR